MMEAALTLDEAAKFLKVSSRTVRRLAVKGELPGRKIGNKWRFSPLAIHLWLAEDGFPTADPDELDHKGDWKKRHTGNHHLDFYGALADNPLTQEVETFMRAEKERQRIMAPYENS